MKYIFGKCASLISLPDISKWNISKVKNEEKMFLNLNISSINKMRNTFHVCNSLVSLLDLSKWNISGINMKYMLYGCNSIISIPDLLKWNIFYDDETSYIFVECILKIK